MNSVEIRKAEREDALALFQLIEALAEYEKLDPPDGEARARLTEDLWGPHPRAQAWICESEGIPVAYAFTFETYSTFLARPTLYLEDLFVLHEYRRNGIGEAFFRHFAREAVARSCGRMEWACLDWNKPGLQFYAKLGAQRMDEWVSFRLNADDLFQLAREGD
jgi:GNAT superfamily N-acetyltransferase